jgi:hypothetical protein
MNGAMITLVRMTGEDPIPRGTLSILKGKGPEEIHSQRFNVEGAFGVMRLKFARPTVTPTPLTTGYTLRVFELL